MAILPLWSLPVTIYSDVLNKMNFNGMSVKMMLTNKTICTIMKKVISKTTFVSTKTVDIIPCHHFQGKEIPEGHSIMDNLVINLRPSRVAEMREFTFSCVKLSRFTKKNIGDALRFLSDSQCFKAKSVIFNKSPLNLQIINQLNATPTCMIYSKSWYHKGRLPTLSLIKFIIKKDALDYYRNVVGRIIVDPTITEVHISFDLESATYRIDFDQGHIWKLWYTIEEMCKHRTHTIFKLEDSSFQQINHQSVGVNHSLKVTIEIAPEIALLIIKKNLLPNTVAVLIDRSSRSVQLKCVQLLSDIEQFASINQNDANKLSVFFE